MDANFSPNLEGYTGVKPFRFWCQKVIPLVYDDSLSYYELLCKVIDYLNNVINDVSTTEENVGLLKDAYDSLENYVNTNITEMISQFNELKEYVEGYLDSDEFTQDVENALDRLASDGTLTALISPLVATVAPNVITQWLSDNVTPTSPVVDKSLTIESAAADAYMTGIYFSDIGKFIYKPLELPVEEKTKNRWDVSNYSDVGYHILVEVKPGEKYSVSGQGYNANYPLYVIFNDTNILGYSDDTTYQYLTNVIVTIPENATKLAVNARYSFQPYAKKYTLENNYSLDAIYQNQNNIPDKDLKEYTRILLNIENKIYSAVTLNEYNTTGYSAFITVLPGEEYLLNCRGFGNYHNYILYDENMNLVSSGGTTILSDYYLLIPNTAKYLRVQNNLGNNIVIKKKIPYAKTNIIWLGDSYTQANSLPEEQRINRFATLVSNRLGLQEYNYAIGGQGLFASTSYPNNFLYQITQCAASMSPNERSLTKYIVICGGRNDPYIAPGKTQSDYDSAVSELFNFINTWYPDTEVVVIPYLWDATFMSNTYYNYYRMYINSLMTKNCRIITNAYTWMTGMFDYILPDNVHPNIDGHKLFSDFVYNSIIKSDNINIQEVRINGTGDYMYDWSYITIYLDASNQLSIFGTMNISSQTPSGVVLGEYDYGNNKKYRPYMGNTSTSLLATNLSTGINYSIAIVYDETNSHKIQIKSNSVLPVGVYLINYTRFYGRV